MKKIFLPLLALLCLVLPARAAGFYDLPADHWAQEEIRRAVTVTAPSSRAGM